MISNFINKLWIFITSIDPLVYAIIVIVSILVFIIAKCVLEIFSPKAKNINGIAALITIFVGLPFLGFVLLLIVHLLFYNLPF